MSLHHRDSYKQEKFAVNVIKANFFCFVRIFLFIWSAVQILNLFAGVDHKGHKISIPERLRDGTMRTADAVSLCHPWDLGTLKSRGEKSAHQRDFSHLVPPD